MIKINELIIFIIKGTEGNKKGDTTKKRKKREGIAERRRKKDTPISRPRKNIAGSPIFWMIVEPPQI